MKISFNDKEIVKMTRSKFIKQHKHLDSKIDLGAYYDTLKNVKGKSKQVVKN